MLVLSRKKNETICIGNDVEVTIVEIRGDKARVSVQAPPGLAVHRKEVYEAIQRSGGAGRQQQRDAQQNSLAALAPALRAEVERFRGVIETVVANGGPQDDLVNVLQGLTALAAAKKPESVAP